MKYIIPIIAIIAIIITFILLVFFLSENQGKTNMKQTQQTSLMQFEELEHDFGVVKQSGGIVKYDFDFTYTGDRVLTVTGLPTSCGCTSASISSNVLKPGTSGTITVSFDPNLHAEPEGRFYKTVTLMTEPQVEMPQLTIWAQIDLDLGPDAYKEGGHEGERLLESENLSPDKDYRTIKAATLKSALEDKHFFLIDVHIPEQEHINGTDAVIAYDQIEKHLDLLPKDKSENIVLYCRSGSMSQQAAQTLSNLGYQNVTHVQGGLQAYKQQ